MLNLNHSCLASSFNDIQEKIHKKNVCRLSYNFSKTAAIVSPDCGSAIYVNFESKRTKTIIRGWPSLMSVWKSDTIAYIKGSCGTGCSQSIIFMEPSTRIVCPTHEYRIESWNPNEPPDFYNNNPLLIEPIKKLYICYAEDDVVQVFQMPRKLLKNIHPPKGYYADEASIRHHHLVIDYRNVKGTLKQVLYPDIKF